ncbi:hypothetical protein F66182_8831, partial [Fusarium sp. NRRL 66182]
SFRFANAFLRHKCTETSERAKCLKKAVRRLVNYEFQRATALRMHLNPPQIPITEVFNNENRNDVSASVFRPNDTESFHTLNNRLDQIPAPGSNDPNGVFFSMNDQINTIPVQGSNDPNGVLFFMNDQINTIPVQGGNDPGGVFFSMNDQIDMIPIQGGNDPGGIFFFMNNQIDTIPVLNDRVDTTRIPDGNNANETFLDANTSLHMPLNNDPTTITSILGPALSISNGTGG